KRIARRYREPHLHRLVAEELPRRIAALRRRFWPILQAHYGQRLPRRRRDENTRSGPDRGERALRSGREEPEADCPEVRYDVAPAVARLRGVHLRIVTAEDRRARTCGERSEVIRPQPEGCRAQRDPDRRRRVDGDCRDRQLGAVLADGSREAHHLASRDPVELGPGQLRLRSAHTPAQLVEEHGAARRGGQHLPNQTLAPRRSGPPVHHDRAILVLRWPGDPCHRSTGPGVPARYAPAATPSPFHSSNCFGSSTSFAKANRRSFSSTSKSAAAPAAAPFCSSPPND